MDLYEACENGNEERVVEVLVFGEHWHGFHRHHHHVHSSASTSAPPSPVRERDEISRHVRGSVFDAGAHDLNKLAGNLAETAGLLRSPREMLATRGTAGRTPLLAACMGGQLGVVRLLLGESCPVYFTSRTQDETEELLRPLADEFDAFEKSQAATSAATPESHFEVTMVTKDGDTDFVPVATVRFTPSRSIAAQDLLDGVKHVDDFGNTPLQCGCCFGCGTSEKHIDDGLELTRQLLLHGDQPNLPKIADQWTPLHWAAYNGNHELCAILMDPLASLPAHQSAARLGKTQFSIPLLVNSDNLFAADVAGRRGLALAREMQSLRSLADEDRDEYARWRLRLDHIETLRVFTREFLANASSLVRYVSEMNARVPLQLMGNDKKTNTRYRRSKRRRRMFTCADAIRYGQHLLYWMGCFGLEDDVRELLEMKLEMPTEQAGLDASAVEASAFTIVHLRPLYVCSCEENKRQSVLHAVAAHGQEGIVRLLLEQMLFEQRNPETAARMLAAMPTQPQAKLQTKKTTRDARAKTSAAVAPARSPRASKSGDTTDPVPLEETKLDVLPLADVGWRNYRNESPLFLSVLYLRDGVVRAFREFLSPASLRWELANCNVEGSYIHHVTNEAIRRELALVEDTSQRLSCAEYVLLFDGVHKKQFKESVIETMREESVVAPSLKVTRAGHRLTAPSLFGLVKGRCTDYIVVGATDKVLVQHAQALQLKIKHRGSTLRSKYNAATPHLFEPFRSLQRQQVVRDIIEKNINLKKHLAKKNLRAIFPLHDTSGCKNIMRHWVRTDEQRRIFQPFVGNSLSQFLLESRTHQYEMLWPLLTYFGEKHAFYYAFLLFYTVWLVVLAVPGAVCQVLWSVGHAGYVAPLFAIFTSLWATLFVERWKRKRSEIQTNFGNFKRNRSELAPEFYGDFQVEAPDKPVVDTTFPKSLQLVRIYAGIPVLLTMASLAVAIFIGVKLNASSTAILEHVFPWMPTKLSAYVIPVLNAVSMLVLDNVYTQVAVALTQWENHRTVWEFESMLATKLFWFKFLNAFLSLFWVAFVDKDAPALRKQLVIIMGARQLWYMTQRSILPLMAVARAWQSAGFRLGSIDTKSSKKTKASWLSLTHEWYFAELVSESEPTLANQAPPPIVLLQELMQPSDFLMGKQMEIVLQFGYITMFVSVLPVAPLLALGSVVVSTRLDVACCTQAKRRPPFESETEVSTFMSILEFMSFAAVAVNCAVLFFTTMDDFESLLGAVEPSWHANDTESRAETSSFYLDKLWVLLVLEHAVLGLKAMLSLTIDDAAAWVQNDEDRADVEASQRAQQEKVRIGLGAPPSARDKSSLGDMALPPPHLDASSSSSSSAVQRVLADKYELALRERDAALERERLLQRQLSESMPMRESPSVAAEQLRSSPLLPPSGSAPSGRASCAVCWARRGLSVGAARRCLACRASLCGDCDVLVHLDDLGVREPRHMRVTNTGSERFQAVEPIHENVLERYTRNARLVEQFHGHGTDMGP